MENKTRKQKWTKKLKAIIISLSLAFVVALGGACAAIGITVAGRNQRLGGSFAGGVADENVPQLPAVTEETTFYAGKTVGDVTYATNAEAWAAAVNYSVQNSAVVKFDLTKSWTATADTNGFATDAAKAIDSTAFSSAGALNIPKAASVIFNISKNVKLDRNLADAAGAETSKAIPEGMAFNNNGTLYITGEGTITGANNTRDGGVMYVYQNATTNLYGCTITGNKTGGNGVIIVAGTFNMYGGTITNNHSSLTGGAINSFSKTSTVNICGGTISNNSSEKGGGAIYANHILTMSGGTITGNTAANWGGGIFISSIATFTMTGGEISKNSATDYGGGIYSLAAGEKDDKGVVTTYGVTINGGKISDNTAKSGGGVYAGTSSLVMNGGEISGNTCSVDGGGILFYGQTSTFVINDGVISGNVGNNGGGIMLGECTVTMNDGTITQNTGNALGGGVRVYSNSTFNMNGGTVSDNVFKSTDSNYGGGAFFVDKKSTLNLTDATVTGNTSTQQAGGIYINDGCTLNATNSTITNNKATLNGGGIKVADSVCATLNLTGVTISDNEGDWGGGIHYSTASAAARGTINIHSSHLNNNLAHREGGGIFANRYVDINIGEAGKSTDVTEIANNTATFGAGIRCTHLNAYYANFHDNKDVRLPQYGGGGGAVRLGAVQAKNGDVAQTSTFDHCTFANNSTQNVGGALSLEIFSGGTDFYQEVTINECTFTGNTSAHYGGAIYSYISQVTITKSTFTENKSQTYGGAIYNDTPLIVRDSTFTDNSANMTGGAMHVNGETTLVGVTVQNNTASSGGGIYMATATSFGGKVIVTDNTNNGAKDNVRIPFNVRFSTINSGADVFDWTNSRIGLSGIGSGDSSQYFSSMFVQMVCASISNADKDKWSDVFTTDDTRKSVRLSTGVVNNTQYYGLAICKTQVSANPTAANYWSAAVSSSSADTPQIFELAANWTADSTVGFAKVNSGGSSSSNPIQADRIIADAATVENAINTVAFADNGHQLVVPKGKNVILNLNGYNISRNNLSKNNTMFFVAGKLTVNGPGTIGNCTDIVFLVENGGEIILNGATISGSTLTTVNHGVVHLDGGKFTMNNGTITANPNLGTNSTVMQNAVVVRSNSTFEMNGGNINSAARTVTTNGGARGVLNNGTFTMNGGSIYGFNLNEAGAGVRSTGDFTMTSGIIGGSNSNHNATKNSGGGVCVDSGTFTMTGGNIFNNDATKSGGGVYIGKEASFTMSGGHIETNAAVANGGGVYADGEVIISGGEIYDNIASASGGGIYISSTAEQNIYGSLVMSGGSIRDNQANDSTYGGGGVFINGGSTFTMSGGSISENTGKNGGGIYCFGTFNFNSGEISGNTATHQGGGVWMGNSTLTIKNGKINGNLAKGSGNPGGGGLYTSGATVIMEGGSISDNISEGGAGLYLLSTQFTMYGGVFSGNKSHISGDTSLGRGLGGAVALVHSTFTMTSKEVNGVKTYGIIENNSANRGGAFYLCKSLDSLDEQKLIIEAGIIRNNDVIDRDSSTGCGGAIFLTDNSTMTLSGDAVISDNTASSNGGGVYVQAGSTFNMDGGTISGNYAETNGGGVCNFGSFVMSDGVISGNVSKINGGGVVTDVSSTFTMNNGEIYGNEARDNVGGGVLAVGGTFNFLGGKIYENTAASGGGIYVAVNESTAGTLNMGTSSVKSTGEVYSNSAVKSNGSSGYGGGVAIGISCAGNMYGGTISDNSANNLGGGVYVAGTFNMNGGTVSGNVAYRGGGIYTGGASLNLSGDAIISDNTADYGGGIYATNSTATMNGGTISNNSAINGGGVVVITKTTFTLENGNIVGNEASGQGGGVYVNNATFEMTDGTIGGDTAEAGNTAEQGGGVYVCSDGTFTMENGTISGNTAENGGGVYNSGTFTMKNGTIAGNEAVNGRGGGVSVAGNTAASFTMNDGTITDNTTNQHGGGVYLEHGTTTIAGGTISDNNARHGGGIYLSNAPTVTISGGTISGNNATSNGGGVFNNAGTLTITGATITGNTSLASGGGLTVWGGTTNFNGKIIVNDNTTDGVTQNVYLSENSKITVNGALASTARIGITTEAEVPVTITSGYTSSGNSVANARNIFSADAEGVVAVYESNEIVLKQGVVLTVNDDKGTKIGSISTVSDSKVLGSFDEDTSVYTLTEANAAANSVAFTSDVIPAGYAAYMYAYGDADKKEITEFTMGTTNATVCIGTKALERDYTIHYFLESADGSYGSTPITVTHSGLTGSAVVVVDSDGNPFGTIDEHYSLDNTQGDWQNATVEGDGSTEVNVYLKLAEYTVTYTAQGATPSRQTRRMKYGAKVIAPARTPSKSMSRFVGWCDASGNLINFDNTTLRVTENMTLTAKFDMDTFHVNFNLNIDGEDAATSLPSDNEISVPTTSGLDKVSYLVAWDYERLFPEDKNFNFRYDEEDYGVYVIDYTIDNIPNTMSIRNVRPTAVGYTFDGWYRDGQLVTTLQRPNVNTPDNIELVAHWSPASYTMRYDKQDGSWNSVTSDTVTNMSMISDILPEAPTRAGYTFDGWYITPSTDEGTTHTKIDANAYVNPNDGKDYFSIAKIAYLYELTDEEGNGTGEYDFSELTLYAEWRSVDVYIVYDSVDNISLSFANGAGHSGSVGVTAQAMHVNDVVTVTPTANNGFRFTNLIVNGREQSEGVTEFTIRESYLTDYEYNNATYKVVRVSAVCSEQRFRINYDVNGGTSTSVNFARTYSPSELLPDSASRAKLSSNLTKEGFDFMGWEFTSNNELAFTVDAGVNANENLYGKNLWLAAPTKADGVTVEYREVWLRAIWKAQPATVNLYSANYNNVYEGSPEDGYIIDMYGAEGQPSRELSTGMVIEIINPERPAFDFLGWATSSNGAVVYPAVEGNTVTYTVNADHDVNGNALNRNNLYAVWHIKGVDRIIMSVNKSNATYGEEIRMTAVPAQEYTDTTGATITVNYSWYKIFEGMYDNCFTVGTVYIDGEGKVTGYEFNGVYSSDVEGKTVLSGKPDGEGYEYKRFETSSAADGYSERVSEPSVNGSYTVRNVKDCGRYVCVVEVVATIDNNGQTTSTTRAGGYGEIEIAMSKAVYGNLLLDDASVVYNSEAQWSALKLTRKVTTDGSSFTADDDEVVREITLPDESKVLVTYKYFVLDSNNNRREITSLSDIRNVGTYYAEVSFAFTPDGDKGNYEPLGTLEAELEITPFEISNIGFTFVHGDDNTIEQNFSGQYDGTAYSVVAAINQRFDDDGQYIADKDDIQLVVQVNDVTENGDVAHAGETVSAGRYSLVITGKQGSDAGNYVFKSGITLRREYTIGKNVYDVSGKIKLEDKTFEFDNKSHKIEIEWEGEWPETVTPVYEITFEPEEAGFKDSSFDQNNKKIGNDGVNAGVYTVTVSFNDSAAGNFEALESLTATMTITKTNVFEYMEKTYGEDLLEKAGFVGGSFAYSDDLSYLPVVNPDADCRLNNKNNFAISYRYYKVTNEDTGEREELAEGTKIHDSGKYEIVALITYNSALYRNNFDEVQENESTITYVIRNFIVKNVSVVFDDAFEAGGRVVNLGKTFNYEWIKQINVLHEDPENHEEGTRRITREEDIALADITLENDYQTFWHVGEFRIKVGVYGTDSQEYVLTVKEEVTEYVLKYRVGTDAFTVVPDDGLKLLTEGEYDFLIEYSCTDGRGATITKTTEAFVAESGLALGENKLTATEDYYTFDEIPVDIYKVITEELTWQYSADGGAHWRNIADDYPDYTLPYIGTEYLIRVEFTDGGVKQHCLAKTALGVPVLNYTRNSYSMVVGRSGNYKVDAGSYSLAVGQRELQVTWSDNGNGFTYNGMHQSPVVATDNLAAVDKGRVTFGYQLLDTDGNALQQNQVVGAGTYGIKVVLNSDDTTYSENYLVGTEAYTFTIHKADIDMSEPTYSESNYGPKVTYANNTHGLRVNALQANFNRTAIGGDFAFVKSGSTSENYADNIISGDDAEIKNKLTGTSNYAYIDYAYIPDDTDNYNVKIGQFRVEVKPQAYRTSGTDALLVVLGAEATPHYLIGQPFSTKGILVYRLYESYYTEGDKWYGFRGDAVANPNFRFSGNIPADGQSILPEYVSGGKLTLIASSGPLSGSIQIPVVDKAATDLEISSSAPKTVFYVGETYDFSDLTFRATFEDGTYQDGLTKGSVRCATDGEVFDTAGVYTLVFSYFDATCELEIEVKERENLVIAEFTTNDKTLIWTGEVLTAPALKFIIDGKEYTTYDGIEVKYVVRQGQTERPLRDVGFYEIYYTITVTNPRFNKVTTYPPVTVEITKNPYRVVFAEIDREELTVDYTLDPINIVKPELISITDTRTDSAVDMSRVDIEYYINGNRLLSGLNAYEWTQDHVGTFKVEVIVKIDGEAMSGNGLEYKFVIEQAENSITDVEISSVVLGDGADFEFPVTAGFGAGTAVYTYSKTGAAGSFTEALPNEAGTWYVMVTIPEEAEYGNYAGCALAQALPFDVRNSSANAAIGEGSISGGNGIGDGWRLEIRQMAEEDVSQVSINRQNVLDGYEVLLKAGGSTVTGEGEYTVRVKLSEELKDRTDLKVFFKDAEGNTSEKSAKVVDGYVEFTTSEFGTFIITSQVAGAPVGLLVAVIILAVVAAGMLTACIIVFVKKKKGAQ